jgi:hypothetical protein
MDESFLQTLLHDVFGVLLHACEAQGKGEYRAPVTLDENLACMFISVLGVNDSRILICPGAKGNKPFCFRLSSDVNKAR